MSPKIEALRAREQVLRSQREPAPLRILRIRDVRAKTGLSTSRLYAAMAGGTFPRCVPIGPRVVGWVEGEIDDWITAQIAKRDAAAVRP
jgi:prophage regulatory protein